MPTRTSYAALAFNTGELKPVDQATTAAAGITSTDLTAAEAMALRKINQFIMRVAGPVAGAAIVAVYLNDANTLDPIIVSLAELMAASIVLERWERYNHGAESLEGQNRRTDATEVAGRATRIAKDIFDAGGTVKSDGTFRRWFYPKGQQGPRVSGPLASGSMFDHRGYRNVWGETLPGPIDPYDQAKR